MSIESLHDDITKQFSEMNAEIVELKISRKMFIEWLEDRYIGTKHTVTTSGCRKESMTECFMILERAKEMLWVN